MTPEAVTAILERQAPGIVFMMTAESLKVQPPLSACRTPMSRACSSHQWRFSHAPSPAHARNRAMSVLSVLFTRVLLGSLIITLPGSTKAVKQILAPLMGTLPHAIKLQNEGQDAH